MSGSTLQTSSISESQARATHPVEDSDAATVSIIMATFNGEKYIAAQLESLAAQTLVPVELIVSDDGSTDDTLSLVRAFAQKAPFPVHIQQNAHRLGYGENFLTAARLGTGRYLAFCDQDDVWYPEKLARCVAALQTEDALLCVHNAQLKDTASRPIGFFSQVKTSRVFLPLTLFPWGVFFGFTQVFEKRLLYIIDSSLRGVDNHTMNGLLSHDRWVYFLASSFGKTVTLAEPLANYRQHQANLFGSNKDTFLESVKGKLSVSELDLRRHQAIAMDRIKILSSVAETSRNTELAQRAEAASLRWQNIAAIYRLRADLYGSTLVSERLSAIVKLLSANSYGSFERGGIGFKVLLKDVGLGLLRGGAFLTKR